MERLFRAEILRSLESNLQEVMDRLGTEGTTDDLRKKRAEVLGHLWQEYRVEESKWRQKARVRWIKEGDKNTAFFHSTCKVRQARKQIHKLLVQEEIIEEPGQIKEAILNHFKSFFHREDKLRPKLKCSNLYRLNRREKEALEQHFSELEIWNVVRTCDGNRAPGPDGFNINFFKKFWSVVKEDILKFFEEFHTSGKLVRGLNSAFIALIPKHNAPLSVSDYRPISLIGSAYKLISKVLAS